jgi:translocation and assembly module TamB
MAEAPKRRGRWLVPAIGAALAAGGAAWTLGPGAAWIVDNLADGQRVWRLGRIEIDGVSGAWAGALRAEHVSIADDEGVWLDAQDLSLNWHPQDIVFGALRIDRARARRITLLRQPVLLDPKSPGGVSVDVQIEDLRIEQLSLAEPVLGDAADFSAVLSLAVRDKALAAIDLDLRRTDSDADRALVQYRTGADFDLSVDIEGAPQGAFARALGVADQSVRATADGDGDPYIGAARYQAQVGDAELLSGAARWSAAQWAFDAQARLDVLPILATLARRIGPNLRLNAHGASAGAFSAHAETPFIALDLSGALDENHALDGPAQFAATTHRLSDIARESPFPLGAARLEGELRRARGTTAIQATLDANDVNAFGRSVSFHGPVNVALTPDRFTLDGDVRASEIAPALFAHARLRTELAYDRTRRRFSLGSADLSGDALSLNAQGWVNRGEGEFSGEWRVRRLDALLGPVTGQAAGRWRAFSEPNGGARIWTTTIAGAGERIGGAPEIVPQLLGASPRLDARLTYENHGLTISHARIDGAQLRAGASGRIVRGIAELALEASARGPLSLGGARIEGAADATGRLTGRFVRPTLSAHAIFTSFSAGGVIVTQPIIDLSLAPTARSYGGRADVTGVAFGQPLNAAADLALADNALALTNLDSRVGAMQARGAATLAPAGASAQLTVSGQLDGLFPGVSGRVSGELALSPEALALDAQLADVRVGELRIRGATLAASGPLDAIAARFDLRGRLRQAPLAFAGTATLANAAGDADLAIEGRGTLAGAAVFTRAPMRMKWEQSSLDTSINVALGDGIVQAHWRERGRALSGSAQIDDAPLAPLAAIWGERAEGRIDGRAQLANLSGGLSGGADLTLTGARFAGRQSGRLNMHIVGRLDPDRLAATIDASSTEGLVARFEANAPVVTSTAPIRVALTPERRGNATWSVRGPAESLWAAARLPDQSLEGQLSGEGELQFGAGHLSGDGSVELTEARFEDKLTGITLTNLDARIALDERGVTLERFTAGGPHGGTLTATGGSANPREGRIAVTVQDMRVADRPDARARASGELTLAWEGLHSMLTGALTIEEADIDVAASPNAGIATLDVVEINRPDQEDDIASDAPPRRNGSTDIDVRITAPGRVFTRGRGIDAEWSLDLRLDGTARVPRLYGEARAIRGTLALSGQPFEIEDARIFFNGDPLDAQIDMTAVRDTADLTARARLTGTARDPELAFSSNPALPEDEILPQILFGRSVEDLSAFEAAQLAASLAALSGRASLDLVDAARAAAGLDRFNVRQDQDGGFLVAGGIYLTRDVYVELARTGLGQAQTRVEWAVRPRLLLVTSFLGNGDQRVSLRWRRESD